MHKKLTALFCVLTLVLSVLVMPVSADVTEQTASGLTYIINDQFNDGDLGDWELSLGSNSADNVSLTADTTADGSKVMKLTKVAANGYHHQQVGYAYLKLPQRITFEQGKYVVVKARVMQSLPTGVTSNDVAILANAPKAVTNVGARGSKAYFLAAVSASDVTVPKAGSRENVDKIIEADTNDSWVDFEIVFDGSELTSTITGDNGFTFTNRDGYTVNAKMGEQTATSPQTSLFHNIGITSTYPGVDVTRGQGYKNAYMEAGYTDFTAENFHSFEGLDSLAFLLNRNANNVYVDYVQIFEVDPNVTASVPANTDYGIIYRPTELSLNFNYPIDYKDGEIVIKDEAGNTVEHNGSYDETTCTFKASFNSELAKGSYKFVINDSINPLPVGSIDDMHFEKRTIDFKVYDTLPPRLEYLTIDGFVAPGCVVTADYNIVSNSGTDYSLVYKWFASQSGEEGTFEELEGFVGDTLDITAANAAEKYIMLSVIPQASGVEGVECFSNVLIPETAPVISNLKLSASNLFPNSYLTFLYDFSDINGDPEDGTVVEWFTSPDGTSNWQKVSENTKYHITEADLGLYIKCAVTPKSDSLYESTGTTVESEVAGPVSDILATTNMYVDPSFETTKMGEYWRSNAKDGVWIGASITKNDARTGQYSLRVPPRASVHDSWGQDIDITIGNVYLVGGYAKKASDKLTDTGGLWPYCSTGNDAAERYDKVLPEYTVTKRWQLCAGTFLANASRDARFQFLSFETISSLDAIFDDMYLGELLVADIETFDVGDVLIPQFGETAVTITSGKILNQLGTTHGLVDETIKYDLEGAEGVSIEDGNLIITNRAKAGMVNVRLYVEPQYPGADQIVYEKYVTVNLVPNNDPSPKAYDLTVSGNVAEGSTLTGSYEFYQIDGKSDASTVQWTYCDTEDGEYKPILGANGLTYVVEGTYADKYIKFSVTPKTDDGMVGTTVYSDFLTMARVPVASNVTISGDFNVGGSINAKFDFYDPNGDAQGTHIYNWMIDGVVVHTGETLTLTETMIGKQIKVGVTPVSVSAPTNGAEVWSDAVAGPSYPLASDVTISKEDGRLVGHYTYSHPHGTKEKETTFAWYLDGVLVSNKIDYLPDFEGTKTVTFSVTPKSEGNPSTGQTVSVSISMGNAGTSTGGSTGGFTGGGSVGGAGGSGGSSGGGSGASGSGAGVTNINDMNRVDPTKEPEKQPEATKSDIDNHWGKSYIDEMSKRGVMTADENGNFNPDINVSREEMVTFLFDALKLTESEYSSQFADVKDGDFAKKLQTMLDNGTIAKDTNFRPNDTISREEMCKILYVSLKNAGKLAEVEDGLINNFADFDNISEWARVYVNAIYGNKIMVGVSETEFDAKGTVTKAQAATMLVRILNLTEVE